MNRAMKSVLIAVLIVLLIALLPVWPYATAWGYWPSGGLGLLLILAIVLLLLNPPTSGNRAPPL